VRFLKDVTPYITNPMIAPKKFSKTELAKVKVDIVKRQGKIFLHCLTCGTFWLPPTNKLGQLVQGYWQCPNREMHEQMVTQTEVAYHEAGHVVMGYLLGINVDYATIIPKEQIAGQVGYSMSLQKLPPSQQVMIALAGPIAEDMVTKTPRFATFDDVMHHSESDGRGVLQVISKYRNQVDVPGHYQVATYLLNKHRAAIEVVAKALLEHGEMVGDALVRLIRQA